MAATDSAFDHLGDKVHKMAADMADTSKSAEGLHTSFVKLIGAVAGAKALEHVFSELVQHSKIFQAASRATARTNLSVYELGIKTLALDGKRELLEEKLSKLSGGSAAVHGFQLKRLHEEISLHEKQVAFARELNNFGYARLAILGTTVGASVALYRNTESLNHELIKANSLAGHRSDLLDATLRTQRLTGLSFEAVTHSAAALVSYGMDTRSSFAENLKIVSQLETGLGVSVDESARLATVVERQLHGSFKAVADVVAEIVDNTALAGNEAVQLANVIGTAMSRLGPGLGAAGLPDVLRLVGRYEGALKEVGGQAGGIQHLLTSLSSTQGLVGAGVLGVNPEFLTTADGVQTVMDRFLRYGNQLVGQTHGWDRQWRLQTLGDLFGVSADQANQMMLAIRNTNNVQNTQITLQDRWKNQMNDTNAGISRLTNALTSLIQTALIPLVPVIGRIANWLAEIVTAFTASSAAIPATLVALSAGLAYAIPRLLSLANALRKVTTYIMAEAASLTAGAGETAAFAGLGTAGGLAAGGALVLAVAGVSYILYRIYNEQKRTRESLEAKAAAKTVSDSLIESAIQAAESAFYVAAKYHPEQAEQRLNDLFYQADAAATRAGITSPGERELWIRDWLANEKAMSERVMARVIDDSGRFTPYGDRSSFQNFQLVMLQTLSGKMDAIVTSINNGVATQTRAAAVEKVADEIKEAKARQAGHGTFYRAMEYMSGVQQ